MNKIRHIICVILLITPYLTFAQDNKPTIVREINNLPPITKKATYERLLYDFSKTGGDIKEIEDGILNATNNGNFEIVPVVEAIVLPSQKDVHSLLDYYLHTGVSIGALCNKPSKAIEYIVKAIELAEQYNLSKKLFSSLNGQLNHAWGNIGVNYERLKDFKNAASAYLNAANEIKKYYPSNTKVFSDFLRISSYMMYRHLTEIYKGDKNHAEYLPYLLEYSLIGNLDGLSALWNYFIDSYDIDGLNFLHIEIIPKEKDNKAIAQFYWAAAETFLSNRLYHDAIYYNLLLITISKENNFKDYLFIENNGERFSRHEYVAHCFDKLGDNENFVISILNALNDAALELGPDSNEYKYYAVYLDSIMKDPVRGQILQKKMKEMGF